MKLAYLVTHPIQYQAPLLRRVASEPDIELHALFMSDFSVRKYFDPGFGKEIKWDVPLTDGYDHEFLPRTTENEKNIADIRNTGLEKILVRERFDAIWSHGYAHRTSMRALFIAKRRGIRTLIRAESQPFGVVREGLKGSLKDKVVPLVLKLGDAFLTVGSLTREYYLSHGVPAEKMFSVPYAIENGRFHDQAIAAAAGREEFRAELGLAPGRPVILYASKLTGRKKIMDLFEAFRKLTDRQPKPYLVIVGDGEDRAQLEEAIAKSGLRDDVKTVGFQNQTVLPRYFDLCDIFVLPSAREQWGLVVNEVMCANRAVVVSNEVGCGPDLIQDGVNGRIFPVGDVSALAEALWDVVKDPQRCRAMGDKSWDIISKWDFEADVAGIRAALRLPART